MVDFEHSAVANSPVFVRSRWDHDQYYDPQNSKGIADASDASATVSENSLGIQIAPDQQHCFLFLKGCII